MSLYDYRASLAVTMTDPPFYALVMAAMRGADTTNAARLRMAFPDGQSRTKETDMSTRTVSGPCRCVYGPCQLHGGHCCFRTTDSTCHKAEILAATRAAWAQVATEATHDAGRAETR